MAVQELFQKVLGDGARSTKFDVVFQLAGQASDGINRSIPMLVKSTQFPAKGHKRIDLMYKGRTIPVRGQVNYTNEWICTFYLTEDHALKRAFENWIEALDEVIHFDDNLDDGVNENIEHFSNNDYKTDIYLYQASFSENARTSQYVLHNAFPVEVSPIDISYENLTQISTFDVTFTYTHFSEAVSNIKSNGSSSSEGFGLGNSTYSALASTNHYFNAGNNLKNTMSNTSSGLLNVAGQASSSGKIYQFAGQASQAISQAVNSTKNAFNNALSFASNENSIAGSSNATFINSSILKNGVQSAKNAISTATGTVADFTKSVQLLHGTVRQEFSSLLQPFGQIVNEIKGYVNGVNQMKNQVKNTISNTKNQVKSTISNTKNQVNDLLKLR